MSLSVCELVQTSSNSFKSTTLENRATGEEGRVQPWMWLDVTGTKGRLGTKNLDRDRWLEWLKLRDRGYVTSSSSVSGPFSPVALFFRAVHLQLSEQVCTSSRTLSDNLNMLLNTFLSWEVTLVMMVLCLLN